MTTLHKEFFFQEKDMTEEETELRDWLIDYALGRVPRNSEQAKTFFPQIQDIFVYGDGDTESYEDILITTYRDIFSEEEMLAEEYCEPEDMNDETRIEYARRQIESLYQSRESIFSIQIRNDKGEFAYVGGSFEDYGQGSSVNWIHDAFRTKDELKKYFEADDLSDLSDEEILNRFKKNRE